MSLDIKMYRHKPTYVEAVCVTVENMSDIVEWCKGSLQQDDKATNYVKVGVIRPINMRQTQAYVGDWVLRAGPSFKVYTAKGFEKGFDAVDNYDTEVLENAIR
jgi:hypothetical protein